MRISDWSSDVCSSDLLRPCRGGDGSRQLAQQAGHLERDQRALLALVAVAAAGAAFGVLLFVDREYAVGDRHAMVQRHAQQTVGAAVGDVFEEIGRASGRERVGKYV